MTLRIANAAGFLGDSIDAPLRMVEAARVDYLTLEYLAELTLSIMAAQRTHDPLAGYARDFIDVLESLLPPLKAQPQWKLVTNAGGLHPRGCAVAAGRILSKAGLGDVPIGVVRGDDLLDQIDALQQSGCELAHLDTGKPLSSLAAHVTSANAYLGAAPIVEALAKGARIVLTGRVADASLTVGPAVHEFGWAWDEWQRLAAASVAGHVIECGAQATGGYSTDWRTHRLRDIGYPIAELEADGATIITKPRGTGGAVNRRTVVEQLVYEIGDPAHYLTPDVDVDFTTVEVAELADDRVAIRGAAGRPAPPDYKVSLSYADGFSASGQLLVYGRDCTVKAQAAAEIVFQRLMSAGYEFAQRNIELLGAGDGIPGLTAAPADLREVMLRITVRDPRREAVERFAKELAPLITSGPAGLAGYAQGRPTIRPVYSYWPTLVPKHLVEPYVELYTATQWASQTA